MKKKKLILPHSDEEIKVAKLRVDTLREELRKAESVFDDMAQKNFKTEICFRRKEEKEAAQVMTKEMRAVLKKMQGGLGINFLGFSNSLFGKFSIDGKRIPWRLFNRLKTADFINMKSSNSPKTIPVYVITDLGRQALEAEKQKELA